LHIAYNINPFISILVATILFLEANAQNDSNRIERNPDAISSIFSVGLGIQHGFIYAHSEAVENTSGSHPTGIEATLSWQRNDSAIWQLCNCFPRRGLLLSYYDYDNSILGKSITAAYFIEPSYKLTENIFFAIKGSAGLSYLTNPWDTILNPSNRSYSTSISAYLLFGSGLWFRFSHWWVNASVNYQHESNGGIKEPNKGINWATAGLSISYQNKTTPYYTGVSTKDNSWKENSLRWDIGIFGTARRVLNENGTSDRYPMIGLDFQVAKQVGRINMLTVSTEIYRDDKLDIKLEQQSIEASPVKAGVMLGHEFILGKFLFSQRLGLYIFDQTPFYDLMYHRWGIQYKLNKNWGIGFNFLAHRQVAEVIDMRIIYSIQNKN
jgi:hypothetical protein